MSKTMTVSEMRKHWAEADTHIHDWMKSLVGVTIVADPEPRPRFGGRPGNGKSMTSLETFEWIISQWNKADVCSPLWSEIWRRIADVAEYIADEKGMTR